jgi:WD40 repeat protein
MRLAERPVKMVFSPNGDLLALVGIDASIRIWKVPLGKEISKIHLPADLGFPDKWAGSVAFSPDNKLLATSEGHFWDVTTGKEDGRFPPSKSGYDLLSIHSDNRSMISAGQFDGQSESLQRIEISTGKVTKKAAFRRPTRMKTLAISRDGKLMAVAVDLGAKDAKDPKGGIALVEVDTGKVVSHFLGHYGEVSSWFFHPMEKLWPPGAATESFIPGMSLQL